MEAFSLDDISSFSKSLILNKMHRYIRLWYINDTLPMWMLNDPDIKLFYTPCNGHSTSPSSVSDEIDGVFPMIAYCSGCVKNGKYL